MKKVFIALSIATLFIACGKSESSDKATELENLKKQQSELTTKIAKLEAEIAKENPEGNQKAKYVSLDTIKTSEFVHFVEVQGNVESDQNVNVLPRMMGLITSVKVEVGDNVKKGQVLATIDDAIIRKNLDELNVRLELATTVYEKQKKLWEQKVGSEIQYLQAKNNKEALEGSIATLKEQLDMCLIKSPITGVVDLAEVREGEMVSSVMPAFRVVNFNQLKAVGELAESYSSTVDAGDEVFVVFPDLKKELNSKLTFASRTINPASRTFKVEVKLDNNKDYRPNMLSILKIVDYKASNAMSIPMNVIQNDPSGAYVYIAESKDKRMVVKKVMVKVGMIYKGKAEILSGLNVGDALITAGYQDLNEGDFVKL